MKKLALLMFVLVTALLILASNSLAGHFYTTAHMSLACTSVLQAELEGKSDTLKQDYNTGVCLGAFSTIKEVIKLEDNENNKIFNICSPSEITRNQLISVFVNYAQKNPKQLPVNYFTVAMKSLLKAFSCTESEHY